jgi:hypothetical protein
MAYERILFACGIGLSAPHLRLLHQQRLAIAARIDQVFDQLSTADTEQSVPDVKVLRLRSKGHSHGRALRGLADRLLALLCAMLRSGTAYDVSRRQLIPSPSA